jgi:hypothetical protein
LIDISLLKVGYCIHCGWSVEIKTGGTLINRILAKKLFLRFITNFYMNCHGTQSKHSTDDPTF